MKRGDIENMSEIQLIKKCLSNVGANDKLGNKPIQYTEHITTFIPDCEYLFRTKEE